MYRLTRPTVLLLIGLAITPALAEADLPLINDIDHKIVMAQPKPTMVNTTYLGITAERISPALNSQLNLPAGLGLVVTHVVPDSPADQAGVQKHDVLQKLDDQSLVNFQQFTVLIRLREAGDTVALSVIRGGEPVDVAATLGEHEVPEFSLDHHAAPGVWSLPNQAFPFGDGSHVMSHIGFSAPPQGMTRSLPKHFLKHNGFHSGARGEQFELRVTEGDLTIHLDTLEPDEMHLKVEDADGNMLYDGPWDPDQGLAATGLNEEMIKKIQAMLLSLPDTDGPFRIEADRIEVLLPPPAPVPNEGL